MLEGSFPKYQRWCTIMTRSYSHGLEARKSKTYWYIRNLISCWAYNYQIETSRFLPSSKSTTLLPIAAELVANSSIRTLPSRCRFFSWMENPGTWSSLEYEPYFDRIATCWDNLSRLESRHLYNDDNDAIQLVFRILVTTVLCTLWTPFPEDHLSRI